MRSIDLWSCLCLLAALAGAQNPAGQRNPNPAGTPNDARGTRDASITTGDDRRGDGSQDPRGDPRDPQGRDYSPRALFLDYHGEYLQKSRRFEPAIQGSYGRMRDADVVHEPGEFDLDQTRLSFSLPLALDPDTLLYVGGRFGMRDYNFDSNVLGAEDDKYYEAGVNLGVGSFLTSNTFVEVHFRPGIYSDFDAGLHTKDYKWYGDALVTWRAQEDVFLKAGFAFNGTFDQVPVYPRLGVSWMVTSAFRFDLLMPEHVELSWLPSSAWMFSLGAECTGDEFRTRTSPATGKLVRKQQVQEINAYLRATLRFDDHWSLFARVGTTVAGDYDLRDATTQRFKGTLDSNPFFQVGFGVDF